MGLRTLGRLVAGALRKWREDRGGQLAAALSFYALLSLAPLLILLLSVAGQLVGEDEVRQELVHRMAELIGKSGAQSIRALLQDVNFVPATTSGTVIVFGLLFFGAALVFSQIKESLNIIWGVHPKRGPLTQFLLLRLISLAMILALVALLIASVVATAALSTLGRWAPQVLPVPVRLLQELDVAVSLVLMTLLLALIYKTLPDVRIAWRDVWLGSFSTSAQMAIGKTLLGLYLSHVGLGSIYGRTVSLVVILVAVFLYAQIFLFGAELTYAVATHRASGRATAMPVRTTRRRWKRRRRASGAK